MTTQTNISEKSITEKYMEDVARSFRLVVGRFSRGNVRVQKGKYINSNDLDTLRKNGKEALDRLLEDIKA